VPLPLQNPHHKPLALGSPPFFRYYVEVLYRIDENQLHDRSHGRRKSSSSSLNHTSTLYPNSPTPFLTTSVLFRAKALMQAMALQQLRIHVDRKSHPFARNPPNYTGKKTALWWLSIEPAFARGIQARYLVGYLPEKTLLSIARGQCRRRQYFETSQSFPSIDLPPSFSSMMYANGTTLAIYSQSLSERNPSQ